jgi:hypothetical protein
LPLLREEPCERDLCRRRVVTLRDPLKQFGMRGIPVRHFVTDQLDHLVLVSRLAKPKAHAHAAEA